MQKLKIKKVIEDLKELFNIDMERNPASYEMEGKFGIDKRDLERSEVIHKLQMYFQDKVIDGGYLKVGSITMVHTTFEVLEGKPAGY